MFLLLLLSSILVFVKFLLLSFLFLFDQLDDCPKLWFVVNIIMMTSFESRILMLFVDRFSQQDGGRKLHSDKTEPSECRE